MSARFGRNQRRKLRAEVAARDAEVARITAVAAGHFDRVRYLADKVRDQDREVVGWAERIIALLGPESAFTRRMARRVVDPIEFGRVTDGGGPLRLFPREPLDFRHPVDAKLIETARHMVDAFAVWARADRDDLRYRSRFEIVSPRDGGRGDRP